MPHAAFRFALPALPLALALGVVGGCKERVPERHYLARVGPTEISTNDFVHEKQWRARANRAVFSKERLLDELITRQALVTKARELELDKDADYIRSCESLLIATLKEREIDPKVKAAAVTETEIHARYDQDLKLYSHPAKAQLAIIFVAVQPGGDEAEARARLGRARQLAAGLPADVHGFGKVAAEYSEDQASRYKGGDIGWFDEGQERYRWPVEVITAGASLQPGEISNIISTSRGLFLVRKLDSRPATVTPLAAVAEGIRRRVLVEKQRKIEREFVHQLELTLGVTINTQALTTLEVLPAMGWRESSAPPALPQ